MTVLMIILCGLLVAAISMVVWGYVMLSRRVDYVFDCHELLYLRALEIEIVTVSLYLRELEAAYEEAVSEERYEVAGAINETLKHNVKTLRLLRKECDVIQGRKGSRR